MNSVAVKNITRNNKNQPDVNENQKNQDLAKAFYSFKSLYWSLERYANRYDLPPEVIKRLQACDRFKFI